MVPQKPLVSQVVGSIGAISVSLIIKSGSEIEPPRVKLGSSMQSVLFASSPVFQQVQTLTVGERVQFSGAFPGLGVSLSSSNSRSIEAAASVAVAALASHGVKHGARRGPAHGL
jgi:hypothetical protein